MQTTQGITFSTIAGGALEERFQQELEKVIKNMIDPNTNHKTAREITVKIKFNGNEQRNIAGVDYSIASKTAPVKTISTAIMFGEDGTGKVVTAEILNQIPGQQMIEGTEQPSVVDSPIKPSVVPFQTAK